MPEPGEPIDVIETAQALSARIKRHHPAPILCGLDNAVAIDALLAELDRLREANRALHRRCQSAEAEATRRRPGDPE